MEFREIGEYGFFQFCVSLEQAFKDGYELDLESNDNCPQQIGAYYHAILKKSEPRQVELVKLVATIDTEQVVEGIDKIKEKIAELDKPEEVSSENLATLIEKNLAVKETAKPSPAARGRGVIS